MESLPRLIFLAPESEADLALLNCKDLTKKIAIGIEQKKERDFSLQFPFTAAVRAFTFSDLIFR